MLSHCETQQVAARATHDQYISDAAAYRSIRAAGAVSTRRPFSLHLLESLGTVLIGLGRKLCERRGEMRVEVAFRHTAVAGRPHGQHVA